MHTHTHTHTSMQTMTTGPTADYVSQIKRRVQDNLSAREDREKRRRRVLVEQLKAMYELEVRVCMGILYGKTISKFSSVILK